MTGPGSSLYEGVVLHRRLRPRKHQLRYRVFFLLLDLEEIANLDRRLKLFSRNKRNFFTFHDRDYGSGSGEPLKAQVTAILEKAGIETEEGKILVLTMPRVLGYAFNPLNVYFCYRKDGSLAATVYEVNNTLASATVTPSLSRGARRAAKRRSNAAPRVSTSPRSWTWQ